MRNAFPFLLLLSNYACIDYELIEVVFRKSKKGIRGSISFPSPPLFIFGNNDYSQK